MRHFIENILEDPDFIARQEAWELKTDMEKALSNLGFRLSQIIHPHRPSYVTGNRSDLKTFHVTLKDLKKAFVEVSRHFPKEIDFIINKEKQAWGISLSETLKMFGPKDVVEGFIADERGKDESYFLCDALYIDDSDRNGVKKIKKLFLKTPRWPTPDEFFFEESADRYRLWWD